MKQQKLSYLYLKTFNEASEKLKNVTEASLIGTEVEISLSRLRTIQVFVLGNSKNPGSYNLSPLSSISSILFNTEGPTKNGSLRNISLKRKNEVIGSLDLYDLLINANTNNDLRIQSGDALLINPVGSRVKVWGNVNRPAIYEVLENESFEDVLNFASGLSSKADNKKITLSRINNFGQREFNDYSLEEIKKQKRVAKRNANYWFDYLDGLYDRMRAIRRAYDMDSAAAKMLQLGEDLENYCAEDDGWENV